MIQVENAEQEGLPAFGMKLFEPFFFFKSSSLKLISPKSNSARKRFSHISLETRFSASWRLIVWKEEGRSPYYSSTFPSITIFCWIHHQARLLYRVKDEAGRFDLQSYELWDGFIQVSLFRSTISWEQYVLLLPRKKCDEQRWNRVPQSI
jgi:hypothetical protein